MTEFIFLILKNVDCSEEEKQELAKEMEDHLQLLYEQYVEAGFDKKAAVEKAISEFGDAKEISGGLNENISKKTFILHIVFWISISLAGMALLLSTLSSIPFYFLPRSMFQYDFVQNFNPWRVFKIIILLSSITAIFTFIWRRKLIRS